MLEKQWAEHKTNAPLTLPLPSLYDKQKQIKAEASRFNVLCIGRRAGKTYLGQHLALECAAKGFPVGWFAPNYKYLLEVWQALTFALRPIATKMNATERRIELTNGGVIECWTLDGTDDPGRSRKYKLVIVDEAAIAPNLKTVWDKAISPTLTDLAGDAWFLSTPNGLNYFHDLYQRGFNREKFPDWRCWQMPSSVNPFLPITEIDLHRQNSPEQAFKQEYLAEFLQSDGAVFRNVDACLTAPLSISRDHEGHTLVAGVDWGRQHDFTAISIICCHCEAEVFLDRFNKIGWDFQRARLKHLIELWNVTECLIESNSIGSPNLEAMHSAIDERVRINGFETTQKTKPQIIQALALALEKASLRWLPDEIARHELIAYQAETLPSGYTRYSAPEGQWDDTVIARALAWKAASFHIPIQLHADERYERGLPVQYRRESLAAMDGEKRDMTELARRVYEQREKARKERAGGDNWSHEVVTPDNYWEAYSE